MSIWQKYNRSFVCMLLHRYWCKIYQQASPLIKGDSSYLSLQGAWAQYYGKGIHYFNLLYRSPTTFSFTDCQHDYRDNKNLHAMMLPPSCRVTTINPRNTILQLSSKVTSKRVWNAFVQAQNLAIKLQQDVRECHTPFLSDGDVSGTRANVTLELNCTV